MGGILRGGSMSLILVLTLLMGVSNPSLVSAAEDAKGAKDPSGGRRLVRSSKLNLAKSS